MVSFMTVKNLLAFGKQCNPSCCYWIIRFASVKIAWLYLNRVALFCDLRPICSLWNVVFLTKFDSLWLPICGNSPALTVKLVVCREPVQE